jgi:hypothetical protein
LQLWAGGLGRSSSCCYSHPNLSLTQPSAAASVPPAAATVLVSQLPRHAAGRAGSCSSSPQARGPDADRAARPRLCSAGRRRRRAAPAAAARAGACLSFPRRPVPSAAGCPRASPRGGGTRHGRNGGAEASTPLRQLMLLRQMHRPWCRRRGLNLRRREEGRRARNGSGQGGGGLRRAKPGGDEAGGARRYPLSETRSIPGSQPQLSLSSTPQ